MPGLRPALCAAVAATFISFAKAVPVANTFAAGQWTLTSNNTFNSTTVHDDPIPVADNRPATPLPLSFVNNFTGDGVLNAYVTGLDGDGAAFFLTANGTPYYPPNPAANIPPTTLAAPLAIPIGSYGETATVNLPNYITSGRIYFSVSKLSFAVNNGVKGTIVVAPSFTNPSDPNLNVNYGFVEFTWDKDAGLYSNLSYVDYVGLVISQIVTSLSSGTCKILGLPSNAVPKICDALTAQSAVDGQPWDKACQRDASGNPIRVLAPLHMAEMIPDALSTYYDSYISSVWSHYTTSNLTITTNAAIGNFTGSVDPSTDLLTFDHGGTFAKPSISDILGCNSGPFANPSTYSTDNTEQTARMSIVPRLCAAFTRSTLLLPGGDVQPDGVDPKDYYSVEPTHHYSRIIHEVELDGKGYAFSYDDVHPQTVEDVSGLCVASDPTSIEFIIGGSTA